MCTHHIIMVTIKVKYCVSNLIHKTLDVFGSCFFMHECIVMLGVHHTPMQRSNGPPTKKLKSLMDIEIPTPSNVSSQNKSNVPATADPYNSYEQYRNYMEKGYTEPSGTLVNI